MKFSIKDIFSKCDQIRIPNSHLLEKYLVENFFGKLVDFCIPQ